MVQFGDEAPERDIIAIAWCNDANRADEIAALFSANADPSYISHSELQVGLAVSPLAWTPDLRERVRQAIAATTGNARSDMRLATVLKDDAVVAYAFVSFSADAETPFATLADFFVAPDERGSGLGSRFMDWIVQECEATGMERMFLESGVGNVRAHGFFERKAFKQLSLVMMRDLRPARAATRSGTDPADPPRT